MGPIISITNPTPPKAIQSSLQNTSRSSPKQNRLLYRGALSLPDSYILLDGLTFFARRQSPRNSFDSPDTNLLQNPLALSLETMRGRPSLRLTGTVKMKDIWTDESGGIEVDVHPFSVLTRIYFENIFCLQPFPHEDSATKSESGLRVSLGDTDGETTQMVIFARNSTSGSPLDLIVARILPVAPASTSNVRIPRPDDHMPRKPPLVFATSTGFGKANKPRELKRKASKAQVSSTSISTTSKRQKLPSISQPPPEETFFSDLGSGFRLPDSNSNALPVFTIPQLPTKGNKGKEKAQESDEEDIFGPTKRPPQDDRKKSKLTEHPNQESTTERDNRNAIKKSVVHYLTSGFRSGGVETRAMPKTHPEFKEIFGWVYRGAAFALRSQLRKHPLDTDVIEKVVKTHVGMYAPLGDL